MKRRDWLLLLLGETLDPIGIQKGMFLFAMEGDAPKPEKYRFEPYNWGPFSQPIYGDLQRLADDGFIERIPVRGASYAAYRRTHSGNKRATELRESAPRSTMSDLDSARAAVTSVGFEDLLQRVYDKYPEYASKSLFRR